VGSHTSACTVIHVRLLEGQFSMDVHQTAEILLSSIEEFAATNPKHLRTFRIVVFSLSDVNAFCQSVTELVNGASKRKGKFGFTMFKSE